MLNNVLLKFNSEIFAFLTGSLENGGLLVKKHSEKLEVNGDLSFPNTVQSWHGYILKENLKSPSDVTLLKHINKNAEDIITTSKKWHLEVVKVKEDKDRVYLFLSRPKSIQIGLKEALNTNSVLMQRIQMSTGLISYDKTEDSDCLTTLRLMYVTKAVDNLYSIAKLLYNLEQLKHVVLTSRSSYKNENGYTMLCGAVLNSKTGGKESRIKADDYIRMRQEEMSLIAQHKYGVRVSTDAKWQEFVEHLGESAVVYELLQSKPSGGVKVNFDCSAAGSSKGAAFVLYNCARLEAIIRTFNDKVENGTYPPLPAFEDIDFSLLTQEDEWNLVFNYVMGLPLLLNNCVDIKENSCEFRPHHICSFLSSMVRVFSQYYRKIRILTEPRKHLLPVLFARLYLLIILNDTLKTCLKILNIKSVSQMYIIFYCVSVVVSVCVCVFLQQCEPQSRAYKMA